MIPVFPLFRKLSLRHRKEIVNFTNKYPPFSDFNFTSIWTYNTKEDVAVAQLNGNLIIRFTDYITQEPFYSFIGDKKVEATAAFLINYAQKVKIRAELKLIPYHTAVHLKKNSGQFVISEDVDNHDYIISAEKTALLPEETYKRKKYLVERFERKYPEHKVRFINLNNRQDQEKLYDLIEIWKKNSSKDHQEAENEILAIRRLLENLDHFDVHTLCIFDSEKLIAFNIYEKTHQDYGISAFQKADKKYTGIYAKLTHEAAKHMFYKLKCKYINFEQDLGIEGLRLSKSLWKPSHYLKKYKVALKK